jgi:ATP-binding cassette subfamily F protein uup
MLTFDGRGGIHLYNGSYTDFFREHREGVDGSLSWTDDPDERTGSGRRSEKISSGNDSSAGSGSSSRGNHRLKFSYKEAKEYETIEDDIAKVEALIAGLDEDYIKNASDFVKLGEIAEKKQKAEEKLEKLMERYVYLEEKAEQIANQ